MIMVILSHWSRFDIQSTSVLFLAFPLLLLKSQVAPNHPLVYFPDALQIKCPDQRCAAPWLLTHKLALDHNESIQELRLYTCLYMSLMPSRSNVQVSDVLLPGRLLMGRRLVAAQLAMAGEKPAAVAIRSGFSELALG